MPLTRSQIRLLALAIIPPVAMIGVFTLATPSGANLIAHGPIQAGHAEIDCSGCHTDSPGTTRQQVQANLFFVLGHRETHANFGYAPVESAQCLACHERPNERHPIYRFNEPRFAKARQDLGANSCLGCHTEHVDQRVAAEPTICSSCHEDLSLKSDPLDVPHVQLVSDKEWGTCLGCHDFHGNHPHQPQTVFSQTFSVEQVRDYLENGADPYGTEKLYKAKEK